MKSVLFGFWVLLHLNIALGQGSYSGSELATIHPDHPGKCWIEDTKTSYSPGEKFIAKIGCREATCTSYEDRLILLYRGCANMRHPTNCKYVTKNPDARFPGCCPDLVC